MKTNAEKITALDSVRKKECVEDGSCCYPGAKAKIYGMRKPPRDPIAIFIKWGTIAAVALLVAWGMALHFTDPDPYATRVIAECREGGGIPKVEKAQNGAVLGVRCEAMIP